jgi:succinoglycan biosynthesis transport protein ExoP
MREHSSNPLARRGPLDPQPLALPTDALPLAGLGEPGEAFSLHAYWQILRRRRATVFLCTLLVTLGAVLYVLKTRPVYRATATIEVDPDLPALEQNNQQTNQNVGVSADYLQTQVDILKSNELAWKAIEQLGLASNPEFARTTGPPSRSLEDERKLRSRLLAAFAAHLDVRQAPNSRVIHISFESTDPNLATRVANALVDHYLAYNFEARYLSTRKVSEWMAQELEDLRHKVVASQQALVNYQKQNNLAETSNHQKLAEETLSELSRRLTEAQTQLGAKRAIYEAVLRDPKAAALLTHDALLSDLQTKQAELKQEYAKELAQYGPRFYKVVQLRRQLDEVEHLLDQEEKREIAAIRADYQAAQLQVQILSRALEQQKTQVAKLNELAIPYNILQNEYQTNQQLYQGLLQQLKDAEVRAGLRAGNIHVLDRAEFPTSPVRPHKALDLTVGLLSGLLLGITVAFIREALDTSVKQPEEIELTLGIPLLGVIPEADDFPGARSLLLKPDNGHLVPLEQSLLRYPDSPVAEGFRALRTSILMASPARPPQVLLVTSSGPGEGKTTTAVNLALGLAQLQKPVLLVDADLRRGQIARTFGLKEAPGLSGLLTGAAALEEVLIESPQQPLLWILPAGPRPPSPADLLASETMAQALEQLRARFAFILLDAPPILLVTDPTLLSRLADGVVLVAASRQTSRKAVLRSQRILETAGKHLMGVVLNRVNFRQEGGYDYYDYKYYGYYSDGKNDSLTAHKQPGTAGE